MMTNLNLGAKTISANLTSSNTNLSSTITASTFNGWKKTEGSQSYAVAEYIPLSGSDSFSGTAYGTLYNYCAASAQTICAYPNSVNASYDLCPKGWRLPAGGSSGEFQALYYNASYNSNAKMRASIANDGAAFALAGYFGKSSATGQGETGNYWSNTWSSTWSTPLYRCYLYLDRRDTGVAPDYADYRTNGKSIRCVLRQGATHSRVSAIHSTHLPF